MKPDYSAQNADLNDDAERSKWVLDRMDDIEADLGPDCHCRVSWCDELPGLVLIEAWRTKPAQMPAPSFHLRGYTVH